ncbi:MAG TPA: nucleotidyltransferase domain-containing protein [Candidatus Nanoarchaeia archaeon]|nr:nucleotidyltransferase domain-containing protein [Candidatus Nanoarchaeia archaeon]
MADKFLASVKEDLEKVDKDEKKSVSKTMTEFKKKKPMHSFLSRRMNKTKKGKNANKRINVKNVPTLQLRNERDIAMDFATKVYQRFNKLVKSIILFGSTAKQTNVSGSDIDIVMIIDDASIRWDQELIAWYRDELELIIKANPYKQNLHINTIKLTTWWDDLLRGDPVIINVIRDGDALIDFGGFFEPLKFLLVNGKIKSTPEAIYTLLQRAPVHILRSKASEIGSVEGLFWAMTDSAQAALIAIGISPPSPEHIPAELKENFVNSGKLNQRYVIWYRDLLVLHKKIVHREITDLKGVEIDSWQAKTEEFLQVMARLVNDAVG